MSAYNRPCRECGVLIQLREMPNKRWVAFENYNTPHKCGNAAQKRPAPGRDRKRKAAKKKSTRKPAQPSKREKRRNARPYFSEKARDLEILLEENTSNRSVLEELSRELALRKTRAAKKLGQRVALLLGSSEASGAVGNAPDNAASGALQAAHTGSKLEGDKASRGSSPELDTILAGQTRRSATNADEQSPSLLASLPPSGTFRPWLGGRLLGRCGTQIELEHGSLRIRHRGLEFEFQVSAIVSTEIRVSLLSATLFVLTSDAAKPSIKFSGISRREANALERTVFSAVYGADVDLAWGAFRKLVTSDRYLNRRLVMRWAERYEPALSAAKRLRGNSLTPGNAVSEWASFSKNWTEEVKTRNDAYVKAKSHEWRAYFNSLESNPMTDRQVEAVLRDEDHTLVVAGAGTGKTSTVVGKIGFLVESGEVAAEDILALAFARNAADEMCDRVKEMTGHNIEIRTFHSLGFQVVADVEQEKPVVSDIAHDDRARHALIARLFSEMIGDEVDREAVLGFVAYHRYPAKYLDDFDKHADYLRYMRKQEPRTLRGELVKSFEELLIADWLTMNSVRYEYEYPYEHSTASRKRRQYKPDFFLPESGVYLEHFGVGRGGDTAPGIDKEKYNEGMTWKRELHAAHSTTLVESYSWERMEGVLLENLERKLREAGVATAPIGADTVEELLQQRDVNQKLVALMGNFLSVYREGHWARDELKERLANVETTHRDRAEAFLNFFMPFAARYESWLSERREVDFADLIRKATVYIKNGASRLKFRRIVVDEYQDISRGRYRLLRALLDRDADCRIMCVGDDWQSIYGFTGSDVSMTSEFESVFGYSERVDLDRTFRFTKPILESTTRFIESNPTQLRKRISGRDADFVQSIEMMVTEPGGVVDLQRVLQRIESERPSRKIWSVLILGRYNHTEPKGWKSVADRFEMLDVNYMTIHKSKGLEADAVVVLGLVAGRYGFPGEIESDLLMGLVLPAEDEFPRAEERRVLYVAMTRAKEKLILVGDSSNPSEFVAELLEHPEIHTYPAEMSMGSGFSCPECGSGRLELVYPKRVNGFAWRCSLRPYCAGRARLCSSCGIAPIVDGTSECGDSQCGVKSTH
jgi:DNA helicase IV